MSDDKFTWAESAARKGAGHLFDPTRDNRSGWVAGPNPVNTSSASAPKPYRSSSSAFSPPVSRGVSFGASSGGYSGGSSSGSSSKGGGFVALCVIAVVIYFVVTANSGSSSSASNASASTAETQPSTLPGPVATYSPSAATVKPSAGTPVLTPEPSLAPQQISTIAVSKTPTETALAEPTEKAPAESTVGGLAPWPSEGVSYEAERKGFDNGCKHGTLTLGTSGINFDCPSDPGKSFSAPLAAIKSLDNDGVELFPKGKYHFKIPTVGDKDAVHQLLSDWQLRATFASALPGTN